MSPQVSRVEQDADRAFADLGEIGSRSVGMALFLDAILEDGITVDLRG